MSFKQFVICMLSMIMLVPMMLSVLFGYFYIESTSGNSEAYVYIIGPFILWYSYMTAIIMTRGGEIRP